MPPTRAIPPPRLTTPKLPNSLSFTQGFLLGQLSISLLIFAFIKFFIFGEAAPPDVRASQRARARHQRTVSHKQAHSQLLASSSSAGGDAGTTGTNVTSTTTGPPPPSSAAILAKTYYNVSGHQPESLDWFNVLVAQAIAQLRADALQDDNVAQSLGALLNGPARPEYVGEIRVTEVSLGEDFPIFSNCRIFPVEDGGESGRLQARMDVDLSDVITLGVETTLVLNYPKPFVAVLPVALAVSVVRFSGTVC